MKSTLLALSVFVASGAFATPPLEETHTLSPIEGEWLYVRASEASTLFISESQKGKETTFSVREDTGRFYFTEMSQGNERSFEIDRIEKDDRTYNLHYTGDEFAERTMIYPYRDVDEAWVLIHFTTEEENPVHFITRSSNKESIPYLNE